MLCIVVLGVANKLILTSFVKLSVIMMSNVMMSLAKLSTVMLSVIMQSVVMQSVVMLSVIMVSVIMLILVKLSFVLKSVVIFYIVLLSIIILSTVILSVMLSVVAQLQTCYYKQKHSSLLPKRHNSKCFIWFRRMKTKLVFKNLNFEWKPFVKKILKKYQYLSSPRRRALKLFTTVINSVS